jgi:hypothetical protein
MFRPTLSPELDALDAKLMLVRDPSQEPQLQ